TVRSSVAAGGPEETIKYLQYKLIHSLKNG
ncbi:MAG: hypothetical protein ACI9V1_002856, partial [Spirosomataceae bacterium]